MVKQSLPMAPMRARLRWPGGNKSSYHDIMVQPLRQPSALPSRDMVPPAPWLTVGEGARGARDLHRQLERAYAAPRADRWSLRAGLTLVTALSALLWAIILALSAFLLG